MRIVPDSMAAAWAANSHIGDERAFARVTVQQTRVSLFKMLMAAANVDFPGETLTTTPLWNIYSSTRFPESLQNPEIEYPNVKSVQWSRTIDQDVSTGTIQLYNVRAPTTDGTAESRLDQPGYYTFHPHAVPGADPINPATDPPGDPNTSTFARLLAPDNILRTYEGYGFDAGVAPKDDPNLMLTGTWIIDSVQYTADGQITVGVSDLARILREQTCFPPVVPDDFYPVQFQAFPAGWNSPTPQTPNQPAGTAPPNAEAGPPVEIFMPFFASSDAHFGVDDGPIQGHYGHHAFDVNPETYWLSHGYTDPDTPCPPWITGIVNPTLTTGATYHSGSGGVAQPCDISAVNITTLNGGSRVYVSMMDATTHQWIYGGGDTNRIIPYNTTAPTAVSGSRIPYITYCDEGNEGGPHNLRTTFATPIKNVERIRFTVHHLHTHGEPVTDPNRYAADMIRVAAFTPGPPAPGAPPPTDTSGTAYLDTQQFDISGGAGRNPGYYGDYTQIVKLFCAWGGFYWPGTDNLTDVQTAELQSLRDTFVTALNNITFFQNQLIGRTFTGGSIGLGSTTLNAADPTFASSDIGAEAEVAGAGTSGGPLVALITGTSGASAAVLDTAASAAVTGVVFTIRDVNPSAKYTADDAAMHFWIDAANAAQTALLAYEATLLSNSLGDDFALGRGRVYGDFMDTGTTGVAGLPVSTFDHKSLLDCISVVREIIGFNFFVDEGGGVIWCAPNLFTIGNFIRNPAVYGGARTTDMVQLHESANLMSLTSTIASANVRERIFVASTDGKTGALVEGYNPNPTGLRRVAGWCVDTETEIFTQRGWLRYDEVTAGDLTLSIDPETGLSEWQPIREVAIFDAEPRDMIEFKANNFSALTTANHRWLTQRYSTSRKAWEWRVVTSENMTTMDRIPRAVKRSDVPIEATVDDSVVELVAWAYTEGSVRWKGRSCQIRIHQSERVNPANCERIRRALEKAFIDNWLERDRGGRGVVWSLRADPSRELAQHLDGNKAPTMQFLRSLTQEQLDLFIEVSVLGDGWSRRTSEFSRGPSQFFCQNVGPRLDAFLSACALAGVATSSHSRFARGCDNSPEGLKPANRFGKEEHASVTLLQNPWYNPAQTKSKSERRTESMVVWCPSMPKHHSWLARRNGSVYYSQNTDQHFQSTVECETMAELIALRQLFTYRKDTVQIAGYPAIQVDDQVLIVEPVTGENPPGFVHYVSGIQSSLDMESGEYYYTLTTNWLGENPSTFWVFDPTLLSPAVQDYLNAIWHGIVTDPLGATTGSSDATVGAGA